jgi:uncharacterized RmlC-like cupin family protein
MSEQHQQSDQGDLKARMDRFILRRASRREDWGAFSYENDPKTRRAQLRYVGAGGSAKHDDANIVPAEHFTVSINLLPPHCDGAPHAHEIEEVFFVLQGQATCFWWENGVEVREVLGPWDMMYSPAGMMHGFRNDTDEQAYVQVMLGKAKPELPIYADSGLEGLKRRRREELATRS